MPKEAIFCGKHGLVIKDNKCPRCKEWKPFGGEMPKEKRGHYSGPSKRYRGAYERY